MSRDTSQIARVTGGCGWLSPRCGASSGHALSPAREGGRAASRRAGPACRRGWRQRALPDLQGRARASRALGPAARPHAARLGPARRELAVTEAIWRALERTCASVALVRFAAGGGLPGGSVEVLALAADGGELGRWQAGESRAGGRARDARVGALRELPWAAADHGDAALERRRALDHARRQPRLRAVRADSRRQPTSARAPRDTSRDTSPVTASRTAGRVCERCGKPIAQTARAEARYCGKRCRQAASRARLRERSGRSARRPNAAPGAPDRCLSGAGSRRAIAANAAARPPRAPGSRSPAGERQARRLCRAEQLRIQ